MAEQSARRHISTGQDASGAGGLTVYCFPPAGGSAQHFIGWKRWLPDGVEVRAVDLPGHGLRQRETVVDRWEPLVADATAAVRAGPGGPYALAGHSLGALLAYETAATLLRAGPGPALLLVAGRNGPTAAPIHRRLHDLPDDDLIAALARLGGTPAEVLAEPALLRLLLPTLRTDLRLAETYARAPRPALSCPIAAFVGRADRMADPTGALAWQRETTGRFDLTVMDAGHFLLDDPGFEAAAAARLAPLARPARGPGTTIG